MSDQVSIKGIDVHLVLSSGKPLEAHSNPELAQAMDTELARFNQWFELQGNSRLTGMEKAILRTYLAWKLRYEKSHLDPQT